MPVSRVPALCAATTLTAGLLFGSGVASAADLPLVGTEACDAAVNGDATVEQAAAELADTEAASTRADDATEAATDALAEAQAALTGPNPLPLDVLQGIVDQAETALADAVAAQDVADSNVGTARSALVAARAEAAGRLCTDQQGAGNPSTGNKLLVAQLRAAIADLRCNADFTADLASIDARRFDTTLTVEQRDQLASELTDRLFVLDDCQPASAPAPTTTVTVPAPAPSTTVTVNGGITVNPLDDDDSVADVDGTQVTVVPQGSASTGA